ncbi:RDD family protein [Thorsellia kenyensis]|uniref:RDD family protein n=1 Tax=Thorsellia kenyensis TaxID=1549888 RepID=A0ABV6CEM2_9GAMM
MTIENHHKEQTETYKCGINSSLELTEKSKIDDSTYEKRESFMIQQNQLASHSERFIAYVIDILIIDLAHILLLFVSGINLFENILLVDNNGDISLENLNFEKHIYLFSFILWQIPMLLFAFLESSKLKASPGKLLLGMAVIDEQGGKLTFLHAYLRNLIKYVVLPFLFPLIIIQFILKNRQGLHDLILAKSYVVDKNKLESKSTSTKPKSELIQNNDKDKPNIIS